MNAVIYLDVPDWQIGQDVSIYFPDTMVKHCKCELLKEQEAKKVLQIRNVAYRTIGYCPSCGRGLDSYEDGNSGDHITHFCYNCGQEVKWE